MRLPRQCDHTFSVLPEFEKKNEIFEIQKGERGLKNGKLFILNFTAFFSSNENIKLATLIIILTKHTFLHSFICKYKLSRMLNPTGGQMCKKLHVWWLNHLQTFSAVCLHLSFNNYYKDKGCRSESWHFVKNCEEVMNEGEELTMFCQGRG